MPALSTVMRWLFDDEHPEFQEQYARARKIQSEMMADELLEIADTTKQGEKRKLTDKGVEVTTADMIEHRKLQIDTRKWVLARMQPKKYGDRIQHADSDGNNLPAPQFIIQPVAPKE